MSLKADEEIGERIDQYLNSGIQVLYVPSSKRLDFVNKTSEKFYKKLQNVDASDTKSVVKVLEEGHNLVALHLSQDGELNEQLLEVSKKCSETMLEVSKDVPQLQDLIDAMLNNKMGYLYMHTVLASYVAKHALENITWGSSEHIEKVQFVLFFHDIYLGPIYSRYPDLKYEEDLLFTTSLAR